MARSLVLSNGNMMVCLDEWGQVRDFYFPHIGLENHVGEKLQHRVGVFADGAMHWLSSGEFTITNLYVRETLVSTVRAEHKTLGIVLHLSDVVYNEHDIFVRQVRVENTRTEERTVKLFFNQQFHISENKHGDTAYYSQDLHAVIHYKGRRVFLASARSDDGYFTDYSIGLLGLDGREGTWRDAEDGVLSKNAIEHDTVDSVIGIDLKLPAGGTKTMSYWLAAAKTYRVVEKMHRDIISRGPDHLHRTTGDFWTAWVNRRDLSTCGLEHELVDLYKRSLLVMRAHADNKGAVIASGDSSLLQNHHDTYCYCWPRDGGFIALAFLRAGHTRSDAAFHQFCADVLTDEGYLLHKYRADRSLGSSWHPWVHEGRAQPPIQEDETAITLISLSAHYKETRDIELIEQLYNPYIRKIADFLTRYRDKKTGLPLPSFDLWEEQLGTFTYTASITYAALNAAAEFARILGKEVAQRRWASAADEVKGGILSTLVHEDGRVMKSLRYERMNPEPDYTVDASSFYGLFLGGVLPARDHRLEKIYERVKEKLTIQTAVGGVARYEGDNYFRAATDTTGNPWVITTLWLAEYEIARATTALELVPALERLRWARKRASPSGLLSEQYNPHTGTPVSVTPLVWSHAQYVLTFHAYLDKLEALGLCGVEN